MSKAYWFFFLNNNSAQLNEANVCFVKMQFTSGTEIMTVTVEYFLVKKSRSKTMDEVFSVLQKQKCEIKRLGGSWRYLGC